MSDRSDSRRTSLIVRKPSSPPQIGRLREHQRGLVQIGHVAQRARRGWRSAGSGTRSGRGPCRSFSLAARPSRMSGESRGTPQRGGDAIDLGAGGRQRREHRPARAVDHLACRAGGECAPLRREPARPGARDPRRPDRPHARSGREPVAPRLRLAVRSKRQHGGRGRVGERVLRPRERRRAAGGARAPAPRTAACSARRRAPGSPWWFAARSASGSASSQRYSFSPAAASKAGRLPLADVDRAAEGRRRSPAAPRAAPGS